MTLPSIAYLLFLLSVVGIYWSLPRRGVRLWLLVVASIVFYGSLQANYLPLLLVLVGFNFYLGRLLSVPLDTRLPNSQWHVLWTRRRSVFLGFGIVINTLLLVGFKYGEGLWRLVGLSAWVSPAATADSGALQLIMPLGLSFFTFECIAYLVDVYRGSPASRGLGEFAAYKLFFPKVISGPITRFHSFIQQLEQPAQPSLGLGIEGLWLIAWGAFKKLLIADHIAILVNLSLDNLERAGSADIWLAIFAYGLQLFIDFSAYVDIARGSALLLGMELPQNFDFPYFATSIASFWRRWHITLGDWLRNYLYFPLGGSRVGLARTCLNLMIVMLVAGIWHGNNWGFVIWGAMHGAGLVIHRLNHAIASRLAPLQHFWASVPGTVIAWGLTQGLVFASWLPFRLPQPRQFILAWQRGWGVPADVQFAQKVYAESLGFTFSQLLLLLWGGVGLMALAYFFQRGFKLELNWPIKVLLIPVFSFLAWLLAPPEILPYIYFEF